LPEDEFQDIRVEDLHLLRGHTVLMTHLWQTGYVFFAAETVEEFEMTAQTNPAIAKA